jgi:hypothetical protein
MAGEAWSLPLPARVSSTSGLASHKIAARARAVADEDDGEGAEGVEPALSCSGEGVLKGGRGCDGRADDGGVGLAAGGVGLVDDGGVGRADDCGVGRADDGGVLGGGAR